MANPRQRNKARSATYKKVSQSRRAGKLLKKQPPIKGPRVLQEAWDKTKTVKQNYAALGLLDTLTPNARTAQPDPLNEPLGEDDAMVVDISAPAPAAQTTSSLPKGKGRIIRDAEGKVIGIEMGGEEVSEAALDATSTPWGKPMDDYATPETIEAKTDVVRALETLAGSGSKPTRHASQQEVTWLRLLVSVYGEDVDGMAKDLKRNVWQKTPGELKRAIKKAGGIAKLRA